MGMLAFSPAPPRCTAPAAATAVQRVSPGSSTVSQVRRSMTPASSGLAPWACSHVGGQTEWSSHHESLTACS
eukprot:16262178-Heterocapsa_arctica.AAC.1